MCTAIYIWIVPDGSIFGVLHTNRLDSSVSNLLVAFSSYVCGLVRRFSDCCKNLEDKYYRDCNYVCIVTIFLIVIRARSMAIR